MMKHVKTLAPTLLITALFDRYFIFEKINHRISFREVNCRRAAAAAFQENVGRQVFITLLSRYTSLQGSFPHGIDIITEANYFTLGNRNDSYVKVGSEMAKYIYTFSFLIFFPNRYLEYRPFLLNHLTTVKISHWDRQVREAAAFSLGAIVPKITWENLSPFLTLLVG